MTRPVPLMTKEPVVGHERNLAHGPPALPDLLDGFLRRSRSMMTRRTRARSGARSQAALLAFLHVEGGLAEQKVDELSRALPLWLEIGKIDLNAAADRG